MNYNFEIKVKSRTVLNRVNAAIQSISIEDRLDFQDHWEQPAMHREGLRWIYVIDPRDRQIISLYIQLSDWFLELSSQKPNGVISISNFVVNRIEELARNYNAEQTAKN